MFPILQKYKNSGSFNFKTSQFLKDRCNAPYDRAGIYLIYKIIAGQEILIYIGSSGQRKKDGTLKIRKGGLKDRIINGYHPNRFGESKRIKRHQAFPKQMAAEGISELRFYWWVTHDDDHSDFPTDVEGLICQAYFAELRRYPDWHEQSLNLHAGY